MLLLFRALTPLQDKNQSGRTFFSERTDELAHRLRCSLRDLAPNMGISQAMLFAYRSGKHEPTLKAIRKLEAAEAAAGIRSAAPAPAPAPADEDDPFSRIRRQLDEIQAGFPMAELIRRMAAAGAWPPAGADLQLTPAVLFRRYAPPES
jgi:transcriptional regulator with XRE-family HTH domain